MKLFIIGSGFTKAVFKNAPLNSELLGAIREKNPAPLDDLKDRYQTEDIEIALTMLDLDIAKNRNRRDDDFSKLDNLRKEARARLAEYFRRFRFHEGLLQEHPWLEDFIRGTFTQGDVVVSLNYDCLIEGLLHHFGLWSREDGYGVAFGKTSDLFSGLKIPPAKVKVLKIHGSENFHRDPVYESSDKEIKQARSIKPLFSPSIL